MAKEFEHIMVGGSDNTELTSYAREVELGGGISEAHWSGVRDKIYWSRPKTVRIEGSRTDNCVPYAIKAALEVGVEQVTVGLRKCRNDARDWGDNSNLGLRKRQIEDVLGPLKEDPRINFDPEIIPDEFEEY
ncbi:hypothetical protein HY345_02260 [Candidatus Microgenomates bacterium]|nr:hypothetical protein [Candidatus Microgenomates bacterium]